MSSKESILGGVLKYSVSTWLNMIIGFLSVIITTRLIQPDVYGSIYLFISASNVLMYVMSVGMDASLIRFYNDPPKDNSINQVIYKSIIVTTLLSVLLGIIGSCLFGDYVSTKVFSICSKLLVGYLFIYAYSLAIFRYLNIAYRMSFRVKQYTIQNIVLNSLSRLLMIFAALFTDGYIYIICLMSLGTFAFLLLYLFVQKDDITPIDLEGRNNFCISLKNYGVFFRYALLGLPISFVADLNTYLTQQIIHTNLTAYSLGIFASSGIFSHILYGIKGGFSTFWSAFVFKNYEKEHERIKMMHNYIVLFSIFLVSIVVMFRDIIYLFIGKEFHDSKHFFSLLLILPILYFVSESTDKGIYLAKKNEIALINFCVLVVTNIALCILFIPKYGLVGAAYSSAFSAIVLYGLNTYMGQKYYKSMTSVKKSVVGTLFVLLILWYPSMTLNIYSIIFFTIVVDTIVVCVFRKEINSVYGYAISYIQKVRKGNDI